jgi:Ca2+-binding RTX toxin-like protein
VTVSLATGTGSGGDAQGDTLFNFENLTGSNFNDVLEGNSGNNALVGGTGIDTISYEHAAAGVTVSLSITAAQNTVGAGRDTLSSFENVTGSTFNDVLTGSSGANALMGLDGNDKLAGGGGVDTLTGGAGTDQFLFTALTDSPAGSPDTIIDFLHGDVIDLSAIDANTSVKERSSIHIRGRKLERLREHRHLA